MDEYWLGQIVNSDIDRKLMTALCNRKSRTRNIVLDHVRELLTRLPTTCDSECMEKGCTVAGHKAMFSKKDTTTCKLCKIDSSKQGVKNARTACLAVLSENRAMLKRFLACQYASS